MSLYEFTTIHVLSNENWGSFEDSWQPTVETFSKYVHSENFITYDEALSCDSALKLSH